MSPSSPAYPVGVGVNISSQVKVDDISDMGDVQTSCSYICCNQYWKLLLLKSKNDLIPLILEHISLQAPSTIKIDHFFNQ